MIGSKKSKRPERRALSEEQIGHRLAEVGGTDGHGLIIPLSGTGRPTQARFVRLTSRSESHLGIDRVEVYSIKDKIWLANRANEKPATQSSTFRNSVADRATRVRPNGDSRALTRAGAGQWWQVDLLEDHDLSHIVVRNGLSPNSHLTYNFDVQVSTDGMDWDTVYRNGAVESDIARIRTRATELLARVSELQATHVQGQRASQDPSVPFDHDRSLEVLREIAHDLLIALGPLHNNEGMPALRRQMMAKVEGLHHRLMTEWAALWPRSLDFPSETFEQLILRPSAGVPRHLVFMWPPGGTPQLSTPDGRPVEPVRFAEALVSSKLPAATYHQLRERYFGQSTLRFVDGWAWWYADTSEFGDLDHLVVTNSELERGFGLPWQIWGGNDVVSWDLMYDHGGVLDIFHNLLNITWRFNWRTVDELGLLMTSLTLQRRNHAGWLQSRAYLIDEEPTADQLADFHVFLEDVNAAASLQRPVLMTKHSFSPALKHRDKGAFSEAMNRIADELDRSFSTEAAVWFGSLLGLIREGDYIDHDDDVDMMYFSKATTIEEVVAEQQVIMDHFENLDGYHTFRRDWPGKNFHIIAEGEDDNYSVDLFPAWYKDGELTMWHDRLRIFRDFDPKLVFPLQPLEHAGHSLLGPKKPKKLLEDLYGSNWRTPLRSYYHTIQIDDRSK